MKAKGEHGRTASQKVAFWSGTLVIASLILMCLAVVKIFDAAIEPEPSKRSQLVATYLGDDLEYAMSIGIPLEAIGGLENAIENRMGRFDEINHISIVAPNGKVIAEIARTPTAKTMTERAASLGLQDGLVSVTPLFNGNKRVGEVHVTTNLKFIRTKMHDVVLDVMVVALVAILLGFELTHWVVAGWVAKPYDKVNRILAEQADGRLDRIVPESAAGILRRIARRLTERANDLAKAAGQSLRLPAIQQAYFVDVRLPLFLFSTSTEISGAFLPIYARDAGAPDWMSPEMAATAPLIACLTSMAIVAPFSSRIITRFGARRIFLSAVPLTALAMVGIGLGQSTLGIAAWVGGMAFVYALGTFACHAYVLSTTPAGQEARAMSSYLFVIIAGAFCGSSLGGVLADRVGAEATFFFGAMISLVAAVLGASTMVAATGPHGSHEQTKEDSTHAGKRQGLLFNGRFLALVFDIAVPANLGMSVFIWYLVPVVLEDIGARSADIGRVIMLYYLIPLLIGPAAARLADGRLGCVPLLITGMGLSGTAILTLAFFPGFWPMVGAVAVFGFGGALSEVSQHAHAVRIAADSGNPGSLNAGLSLLRLVERLAAIAGLLLGASLAAAYGYSAAIGAVGIAMIFGTCMVFLTETTSAILRRRHVRPKAELRHAP